ncbi:MAG: hypothetical protein ACRD12_11535 [Acidimicrobiales bacterium]
MRAPKYARRGAIVELDARARATLARRHPAVSEYGNAVVVAAGPDVYDQLKRAIAQLVQAVNDGDHRALERLVDDVAPTLAVVTPDALERAAQEAERRARLLRDFGAWPATGADAPDPGPGRRAQRWHRKGRIFGVEYEGATWYLGFQFDGAGNPLPVVAEILSQLGGWSDWDIAAWFVRPNGLLDRDRPVDLVVDDPAAVVAAARRDANRQP